MLRCGPENRTLWPLHEVVHLEENWEEYPDGHREKHGEEYGGLEKRSEKRCGKRCGVSFVADDVGRRFEKLVALRVLLAEG